MRIGDKVYSTRTRPKDVATIIRADVNIKKKEGTDQEIRTTYEAEYKDGSLLRFYGFQINKSVFPVEEYTQLSLFDFMSEEEANGET